MEQAALVANIARLLGKSASAWTGVQVQVTDLVPDGSSRRFFRVHGPGAEALIAVLPPEQSGPGMDEAAAFAHIGRHLRRSGVPVPVIHAHDPDTGLVLCEDLGTRRLFEQVAEYGPEQSQALYEQTVRCLVGMQIRAADGFDPSWCWDTPRYDRRLMEERESGYFLQACCTDLLGLTFDRAAVIAECSLLAAEAARAPARFFLHRDFQCRNIMLQGDSVGFIDFQGGRLGPLAYDLASLLLDPYAALPRTMQQHLIGVYLEALQKEIPYDADQFYREYLLLALQRNLQILGAFAFLSHRRAKPFFARFLQPGLASLAALLAQCATGRFTALAELTEQCCREIERRS
ncbi:aminoglycoside phosphotransferase family protein [Desulfobulbus alkaliphilus]|uniref:aminoglycoside phosphotransferase family protein n=1 Tax=Desulfobulbus alkaliphilus TaxID=869814 RepID=UPI0019639D0A|nr:phosphotransferase [Desulfobulbus alkaliphilus]MBM9537622.1 phosphotransferase [Desulfobulbus alkaliphilus]